MNLPNSLSTIIQQQSYPFLFATISGSHLYGFPSPDSDYDLRGVHILPAIEVVGLDKGNETIQISQVFNSLEIDLVTTILKSSCYCYLKKMVTY